MEQNEKESDNIELRSEKVRNVIGKVPPRLVSLGTVVESCRDSLYQGLCDGFASEVQHQDWT